MRELLNWRELPPALVRQRSWPMVAMEKRTTTEIASGPGPASKYISLLVEDVGARSRLREFISGFGYSVSGNASFAEAAREWARRIPCVCLLDLDGSSDPSALIRQVSGSVSCPLITMASKADLSDRVLYLELGADDFLVKPIEPREVVAKIRSLIRRSAREQALARLQYSKALFGPWTFNVLSLELFSASRQAETLTAAEADLLLVLLRSPNRLLTREQLQSDQNYSDDLALQRSIDVRISRIRKKIECDARAPRFIKTVYGAGYIFACDVSWE